MPSRAAWQLPGRADWPAVLTGWPAGLAGRPCWLSCRA